MLSVFSNEPELLATNSQIIAGRLENSDTQLMAGAEYAVLIDNEPPFPNLEMHVYTPDGVYLTGNHRTAYAVERNDNSSQKEAYQHISVNTDLELESLGINRGTFRVLYSLVFNCLGAYDEQKLWIKEISPSRLELRLQLADVNGLKLNSQYNQLQIDYFSPTVDANIELVDTYLLNFGFNETYQIVNMLFDNVPGNPELIVRLYEPLPSKFDEKATLWISREVIPPVLNVVSIIPEVIPEPTTTLAPPNFDLEEFDGQSVATNFKTWNDLLAANTQTSQQLIDSIFSGSLGVKLNINYRCFDNFVHFSSATERVKNFYYKLQLIEQFTDRIETLSGVVSGSTAVQTNLTNEFRKRNAIVSGFDDFEKYLFFESTGSRLYTHYDDCSGSMEDDPLAAARPVNPWPKTISSQLQWYEAAALWTNAIALWSNVTSTIYDPYDYFATQVRTNSDEGLEYYYDLLEKAKIYDRFNAHKLQNSVPEHLQISEGGDEMLLFVHMLGQHFDILWTYIKHLLSITSRDEHPKDGMPSDLLYHVAKSLGFPLLNGKSASDLWKYSLALDSSGSILQDNVRGITSISDSENTKEIWRRIVNNLPYILKSKGTSRSIKALLTCFGIPSTILTIKEYGGPSTFTDNDHYPEFVHDVFHYAWLSTTGSLHLPARSYLNGYGSTVTPDVLEFRFKTDNNFTYTSGSSYEVFSTVSSSLTLRKETADDNEGTLTYIVNGNSGSISNLEIFDHSWHHVVVSRLENSSASLYVAKPLYGKIIYLHSASFATGSGNFTLTENLYFGTGSSKLYGHFHEIRLWSGSLNDATIKEHALSPATYTYNVDRINATAGEESSKPYYHLLQRFTLANKKIYSGSFYQTSAHPNQRINSGSVSGSIYFIDVDTSGSIVFEPFEESYFTPSPSLAGNSLYTNKIRIESSSLDPNKRLNTKTRIEKSSYDRYSLDSNRVGVYFSPQNAINEDIFNQLGYFEIDDYIGNPGDYYEITYPALTNFATSYWKKYENRNDFEAYFRALEIYDFTLFKYIKRLLPERVNAIVGLVVEPNVLERSKVRINRKPKIEDLTKKANIDGALNQAVSATYHLHTGIISKSYAELSGEVSNLVGEITYEIDVAKLPPRPETWQQHRTVGKYKITETGYYQPIQLIVSASRSSVYLKEKKTITKNTIIYASASYQTGSVAEKTWGDIADAYTSNDLHTSASLLLATDRTKWLAVKDYNVPFIHIDSKIIGIDVNVENSTFGDAAKFYQVGLSFTSGSVDIIRSVDESNISMGSGVDKINTFYFKTDFSAADYNFDNLQTFIQCKNAALSATVPRIDQIYATLYYQTPGVVTASVQEFVPKGIENQKFNGCKLSGAGVNVDSKETTDGGPVVKITKVNPNRIVFANNQLTTIDRSTTGARPRPVSSNQPRPTASTPNLV